MILKGIVVLKTEQKYQGLTLQNMFKSSYFAN